MNALGTKLGALLKTRAARLVLAALLTYGASVASTGKYDPAALIQAIVGAFLPGTTPLQGLEDAGASGARSP